MWDLINRVDLLDLNAEQEREEDKDSVGRSSDEEYIHWRPDDPELPESEVDESGASSEGELGQAVETVFRAVTEQPEINRSGVSPERESWNLLQRLLFQ